MKQFELLSYEQLHEETIGANPLQSNEKELHKITNEKLRSQTKRYERYIKVRVRMRQETTIYN